MIGGTIAILGFYIGALATLKPICIVVAVLGLSTHWLTTIWRVRQLQGQWELMLPVYAFMEWLLLQIYIDVFLYNGSYQVVFFPRWQWILSQWCASIISLAQEKGCRPLYRSTVWAGLSNAPFVFGVFAALLLLLQFFCPRHISSCSSLCLVHWWESTDATMTQFQMNPNWSKVSSLLMN